jgi:hypothetical protein
VFKDLRRSYLMGNEIARALMSSRDTLLNFGVAKEDKRNAFEPFRDSKGLTDSVGPLL